MRISQVVLLAAVFTGAAAGRVSAQHPLVTLPLSDPAYVQLDGLARLGCQPAHVSPFRPYLLRSIRLALGAALADSACASPLRDALVARLGAGDRAAADSVQTAEGLGGGGALTVRATALGNGEFRPLWQDVRESALGDPTAVAIARGRVTWSGGPHIAAVSDLVAQSNIRNDPAIRARTFRSTKGVLDFDEAYIAARAGPFTVNVGRGSEAWLGEGDESLMLSAHGPALDRIMLDARWSKWQARAIFANLNDVVLDPIVDDLAPGVGTQRYHRMLAAHAITYQPTPVFEFTLGETAVLARRGGGIDLAFANPLMLYLMTEHDTSRTGPGVDDDNLTAFGAARMHLGRATLAGELMVDDIQIDAKDRKVTQDQLGWRFRGDYALPVGLPSTVSLTYERLSSYTYLRRYYSLAYQAYDRPLGSELGPDADVIRGGGEFWASERFLMSAGVSFRRNGAQRIDERPGGTAVGQGGASYPSVNALRPAVQRTVAGDLSVQWLDAIVPITVSAEMAHIANINNDPSKAGTYLRVHIDGTYRFRFP
ncbi:MAG: hypothetical protein M3081_01405 [Gemmatimonadota bacterium]|nr:hypothetical protein [Gemmatimonadota bacterium]